MSEPKPSESTSERDHTPATREAVVVAHEDSLIDAQLKLSPADRLRALQSFVEDVVRMRDGRRPAVR
jgi:hypothetical protein